MKLKNVISLLLLTVYSIVLAHNFVPHHHHFENALNAAFVCEVENEHKQCKNNFPLHDDYKKGHSHNSCNFNEKIILAKSNNLSLLYLPAKVITIVFTEPAKQSFAEQYIPIQLPDRHPHNIQLRGPPRMA